MPIPLTALRPLEPVVSRESSIPLALVRTTWPVRCRLACLSTALAVLILTAMLAGNHFRPWPARSVVLTPPAAKRLLNQTLNFTARVSDSNGAPLSGIRVDFDVAGIHPQRGFGFSDQNGVVAFSYIGTSSGRDVVTASVGQLLDDTLVDWGGQADPPQLTILSPSNGSVVPAGTELVATGFALADFPNATIDLITVNGIPVETVDGGGNFFVRLFVGPGENEFEFQLLDSSGQLATQTITLTGQQLAR